MSLRTRLELLLAAALGIGLLWGYYHWRGVQREIGAARVEAADAKAVAAEKQRQLEQLAHEKQTNEDAVNALQIERDRLAADLAAVPAPVIRVCNEPRRSGGLPAAPQAAGPVGEGATGGGSVDPVSPGDQPRDIGPELLVIAEVAERVSAQNRALLQRERGLR